MCHLENFSFGRKKVLCPHISLNLDELETPEKAFYRKAQDIMFDNFLRLVENKIGSENDAASQTD